MVSRHVTILFGLLAACRDDAPATSNPDAAIGSDAPRPDAPPDAPAKIREGQMVVTESRSPDPASIAIASFVDGRLLVPLGSAGGCEVFANTPASSLAAGTVTITGTTTPLTLTQDGIGGIYVAESTPDDLFAPGATITMAATGSFIMPAFSGTVTAPAPLAQVVLPSTISRATPPTVTWTAGTGNQIWLLLSAVDGTNARTMRCLTNDDGSFALTTAALAQLPADTTQVVVLLYRVNTSLVKAGAWDVSLYAADSVTTGVASLGI